jgi:hypothetical protein
VELKRQYPCVAHFSEVLKKTGRPAVKIARLLLKLTTALAWQPRLTSLTETPPALIDYLCFPPIVDNNKIKREVGFSFAYKSNEAIETLIRRSDSK